jgi:hypothetical protein
MRKLLKNEVIQILDILENIIFGFEEVKGFEINNICEIGLSAIFNMIFDPFI